MLTSGDYSGVAVPQFLGIAAYLIKPCDSLNFRRPPDHSARDRSLATSRQPWTNSQRPTGRHCTSCWPRTAREPEVSARMLEKRWPQRDRRFQWSRGDKRDRRRTRSTSCLMDVQMPEMDGFEAVAAIRLAEKSTGFHLPIVGVTAHAMKGDKERCLAGGFDSYLSKPIRSEELHDAINGLMAAIPAAVSPTGPREIRREHSRNPQP